MASFEVRDPNIFQNYLLGQQAGMDQQTQQRRNALLDAEIASQPARERMEQRLAEAQLGDYERRAAATDAQTRERQLDNARGILSRGFAAFSQSSQPRQFGQQFFGSRDFLAAGQLLGLPIDQFSITDQDTDESLRQQAADWARALGAELGTAGVPAEVQTFQHFTQGMSPEDIDRARRINLGLASRAGQTRVMDVNGVPTLTGVMENGQPFQVPLSSLVDTATAAGAIKEAEAFGSGRGQARAAAEAAAPKQAEKVRQVLSTIGNVDQTIDAALGNISGWTAGIGGATFRGVPGTPAFDLNQQLLTIKANIGFDRLQSMRDASPTGGALGQVAVQELNALQASIASLEQAQSPEQLRDSLTRIKQHYANWRGVVERSTQQSGPAGLPPLPQGVTEEDVEYTMQQHGLSRDEVLRRIASAP